MSWTRTNPAGIELAPDAVHVWRIPLDADPPPPESDLDEEERDRAAAMATAALRRRFVAAHAITRVVLGGYAGIEPGALRFGRGTEGKPHLTGDAGRIRFNLAHSGEIALVAVARREVGVDVEWIRRPHDAVALIGALHPREAAAIRGAAPGDRTPLLFRVWTRKEAYLKATGRGLPTRVGRVAVETGERPGVFADPERIGAPGVRLADLPVGRDYAGAVAWDGPGTTITKLAPG